jgi:hypothetical protein
VGGRTGRSRLLELKRRVSEREARGDVSFAEALELMGFLTTLLGSEHIERFIPLATKKPVDVQPATVQQPPRRPPRKPQPPPAAEGDADVPDKATTT